MLYKSLKKFVYFSAIAVIAGSVILGYHFNQFQHQAINLEGETVFSIQSGNTIRQVAQRLADRGFIDDPVMFIALAKLEGRETSIKAGEYQLEEGQSPKQLVELFSRGASKLYSLTLIEGWTFRQVLQAVRDDPVLVQTLPQDADQVMDALGLGDLHPEGRFLPDTYHFPRGTTDREFLKRAY